MMMIRPRPKQGLHGWKRPRASLLVEYMEKHMEQHRAEQPGSADKWAHESERKPKLRTAAALQYLQAPLDITDEEDPTSRKRFMSGRAVPHFV